MAKSHLLAGGAALLLLVSAAAAVAVPKSFQMHPANSVDIAAAKAGQGSLNHAIAAVEELTGGHVLEIHFETGNGAGYYDATITRNGTVDHALVNLKTKQVAVVDRAQEPARTFDFREKADMEMVVRASKVALRDAVSSAEQSSRGVAVSARTTRSGDGYMVAHDVETVRGETVHPVLVDAKTGLVIMDAQAFAEGP
jgi:hypothetical protein